MTFANNANSVIVSIDTSGVQSGNYALTLESYDTADPFTTLKTDFVTIYVTEYVRSPSIASSMVILKGNSGLLSVTNVASTVTLPTISSIIL